VLAAPVPLVSGDTARRQRDLADVVLLAALLGAALSFALSLLVGRALSAPIDRLSLAAAAVGAGDLEVRLPEERPDEFGGLYRSFNRMVQRLRRARSAEVRTARVLAWGEMARQVAHEIKNPLTPIKLSVQHLRRAYRDGRPDYGDILDRNVEGVLREIDQLSEIARAFARFGTPAEAAGPLEPVDLAPVLADTLALYRGGEDGIRYRLELPAATPSVQARTGELKEVLINLLENSRAALDGSGEIAIRATRMEPDWMHLEVSDTGTGIPPDALPHIFEPQFSTRTSGTGLGLAIVRRLVEGWGGEIHAESEPGVGTMMRLRLRVAPTPEQA
jgi:nitrogen fixation/metabolism regulation signal transduction histidine kinase